MANIAKKKKLSRFFYFTVLKLRYLIPVECLNDPPPTYFTEAVAQRCSVKKVFLKISQNSQENTCARVYFLTKLQTWGLHLYCAQACNFIKKYTLAQVFSCEFCEIFKNTFFYGTPPAAASDFIAVVPFFNFAQVYPCMLNTCHKISLL